MGQGIWSFKTCRKLCPGSTLNKHVWVHFPLVRGIGIVLCGPGVGYRRLEISPLGENSRERAIHLATTPQFVVLFSGMSRRKHPPLGVVVAKEIGLSREFPRIGEMKWGGHLGKSRQGSWQISHRISGNLGWFLGSCDV